VIFTMSASERAEPRAVEDSRTAGDEHSVFDGTADGVLHHDAFGSDLGRAAPSAMTWAPKRMREPAPMTTSPQTAAFGAT
jgi:hypothetical protein